MKHTNEVLYEAMKEYVRAAIDFIARRVPAQASADAHGDPPDSGNPFFYALLSSGGELAALPEYRPCRDALLADGKIAGQLDVMVGGSGGRSRSPTAERLMRELIDMGVRHGEHRFDAERFEREYALFEKAFYEDYILYDVIAPLENLLIKGSVELSDDLEISPLTDEDIDPYRTSKVKLDSFRGHGGLPCAVRSKFRVPKVVRRDDEREPGEVGSAERADHYAKRQRGWKEDLEQQGRLNERIEEVVNALRLFGVESVFHVTILYRASRWFGHDSAFPNPVRGDTRLVYDEDEGWLRAFGQFWQGLKSDRIKQRGFIGLATRRLGYAHERHRVEDKIIDLLIAAEALFLSDTGDEAYRGELQYRMAQRAGFLLGTDAAGRLKVYRHMKEAYRLRSKVVHGGEARPRKREGGGDVSLEEFAETTKVYVRLALRRIIDRALDPGSSAEVVNWDRLIFGPDADSNSEASGSKPD